jgi:hypothetical protein
MVPASPWTVTYEMVGTPHHGLVLTYSHFHLAGGVLAAFAHMFLFLFRASQMGARGAVASLELAAAGHCSTIKCIMTCIMKGVCIPQGFLAANFWRPVSIIHVLSPSRMATGGHHRHHYIHVSRLCVTYISLLTTCNINFVYYMFS